MALIRRSPNLSGFLIVCALILASCGSPLPPTNGATTSPPTLTTIPAVAGGKQTLEIMSYWAEGTGLEGLNAMVDIYRKQNPAVEVLKEGTANSGGGGDFDLILLRLEHEQPPDTWTLHAGKESLTYVIPGQLEPITQLFKEERLDKVMPPLLLEQLNIKGEIYTVPLNIHRSNMLWYNPKVFRANNLKPPHTLDEFYAVAETLKSKGVTPLAIGGGFEIGHLFESVLLATFGPDDYVRLMQADPALWFDPRMTAAINTLKKMLDYSNSDRSGLQWGDAAQLVYEGKAGMTIMGDWVEGWYKVGGAHPNVDFGWAAAPGTDGTFMWLSDSFGLARGAPHRDAALAWLRTVSSREGQDAFNPLKGSIPARTDADKSLYDEYQQWSIDQFRSDKLVPSIVHGAAAPDAYKSAYSRALVDFSRDLDVEALKQALNDAVAELK
jgi:glucose/mannose transport system substrate-binding protein